MPQQSKQPADIENLKESFTFYLKCCRKGSNHFLLLFNILLGMKTGELFTKSGRILIELTRKFII